MPKYIPFAQVRQLREAAQSGDERARNILIKQMNDEDFSAELEEYFSVPRTGRLSRRRRRKRDARLSPPVHYGADAGRYAALLP